MHRRRSLSVALVLSVSIVNACSLQRPDNCELTELPVNTRGVEGYWELSLLAQTDGSVLEVSSMLFVRITKAPANMHGGAAEICTDARNVLLKVTYVDGDDRFKDAAMSGIFMPSSPQAADGMISLSLGGLSATAHMQADATVDTTTCSWPGDGGTTSVLLTMLRTGL